MRRTQLYLDDQLWGALHTRARLEQTTLSELVRQALRERYLGSHEQRLAAMQSFVGSRKTPSATGTGAEQVRSLRRGTRLDRLGKP